jgi:uncharacterized protein YbjT (DUF2867 family)
MFLVTGATGQVGRHVVHGLLAGGHAVRALSRTPEKAGFPAEIEVLRGDLTEPASLEPALAGVDALYLLASGEESAFLDRAREAGVRRVVLLSSQTVDSRPGNAIALRHQRAENAVQDSGIPATFLRPGQFASNTLQWAPAIRETGVVRAPFAEVGLPSIHPADIAAVAVAALTGEGHEGQAYALTGPEVITPVQQVRTIGSVLGRDLFFEEITPEQAKERMAHVPAAIADAVLDVIGNVGERDARIQPTVEKVTGHPPRTFEQWVRDNRAAFLPR